MTQEISKVRPVEKVGKLVTPTRKDFFCQKGVGRVH